MNKEEKKKKKNDKSKEEKDFIFRPWITTKNGQKIYAKSYGKKAFKIYL